MSDSFQISDRRQTSQAEGDRQGARHSVEAWSEMSSNCLSDMQKAQSKEMNEQGFLDLNINDPLHIAKVDATFDRHAGTLTVKELDGNAKHKKGESLTIENVVSGNGEYAAPGPGSDGRYDNVPFHGPIPKGDYLIGNGYENQHIQQQHPGGDAHWYKLYGGDGKGGFAYEQLDNGRGEFNLHTGRESDGCVTVWSDKEQSDTHYPQSKDYNKVKNFLDSTKPFEYKPGDTYKGILHVK